MLSDTESMAKAYRRRSRLESRTLRTDVPYDRTKSDHDLSRTHDDSLAKHTDLFKRLLSLSVARAPGIPWAPPRRLRIETVHPAKPPSAGPKAMQSLRLLSVRIPERERFCVQRKRRRETLFALNRIGRGAGRLRRRAWRRTESSNWRC